jgi:hypothetical protein
MSTTKTRYATRTVLAGKPAPVTADTCTDCGGHSPEAEANSLAGASLCDACFHEAVTMLALSECLGMLDAEVMA